MFSEDGGIMSLSRPVSVGYGGVRTIRERKLSPVINNTGYYSVTINKKQALVHRLIASIFIPNPLAKPCVNHKNGIKTDNRQGRTWK